MLGRTECALLTVDSPTVDAKGEVMTGKYNKTIGAIVLSGGLLLWPAESRGQATAEVFTASATVKGAGGASASAPVTITVDRKMSQSEADSLIAAFKSGGEAALRKALVGVKPTGSVKIGTTVSAPTRFTMERVTGDGRLLTILTDKPLLFVGGSLPGAKPKAGYEFAVIDVVLDAQGNGTGTLAPAAKIKVTPNGFMVEDYGAENVQLTAVKKTK